MKLLESGMVDARTVSTQSGVPYGRIYDVLESLVRSKLVVENPGRPKKYLVIEPEIAVETLIENQKLRFDQLSQQAKLTVQELNRLYEGKPKDKLVWKVAIGETLHHDYFDLIRETRREFMGYFGFTSGAIDNFDEFEMFQKSMVELSSRNVKIRIIIGVESEDVVEKIIEKNPQMLNGFRDAEFRITKILAYPFTILDNEKVILKVLNPTDPDEMVAAVYLWQQGLTNKLKVEFEKIWSTAKQLTFKVGLAEITPI